MKKWKNKSSFWFLFCFYWALRGVHKETVSVECKQRSLSYSPIGAIANELDSLKVALQWFPARRGAGCSALNHTRPKTQGMENNRNLTAALLLKRMTPCTLWLQSDNVKDFCLPLETSVYIQAISWSLVLLYNSHCLYDVFTHHCYSVKPKLN